MGGYATSGGSGTSSPARDSRPGRCQRAATRQQRAPLRDCSPKKIRGTAFTQPRAVPRRPWSTGSAVGRAPEVRPHRQRTLSATRSNGIEPTRTAPLERVPFPGGGRRHRLVDGPLHHGRQRRTCDAHGIAVHVNAGNRSMTDRYFVESTGRCVSCPNAERSRCAPSWAAGGGGGARRDRGGAASGSGRGENWGRR